MSVSFVAGDRFFYLAKDIAVVIRAVRVLSLLNKIVFLPLQFMEAAGLAIRICLFCKSFCLFRKW